MHYSDDVIFTNTTIVRKQIQSDETTKDHRLMPERIVDTITNTMIEDK